MHSRIVFFTNDSSGGSDTLSRNGMPERRRAWACFFCMCVCASVCEIVILPKSAFGVWRYLLACSLAYLLACIVVVVVVVVVLFLFLFLFCYFTPPRARASEELR